MRKAKFLFSMLLLLQSYFGYSQSPGDSLYDNSFVHTIHINFYETDFWDTLETYYNQIFDPFTGLPLSEKKYLATQIIIDGNILDTVGVRQKGFFSNFGTFSSSAPTKKPFKVDINEFISGQKYDGLKKFSLNNGFEDPSMMRELLSLDLMRTAGIKAPRMSYANLYLNGTHWGLYILMEQVDEVFLNQNFSNGNGNLYKCINNTSLTWQGSSDSLYFDEMELKTNRIANNWSDFIRFMKVINKIGYASSDYVDSLNAVFNVEDYLTSLAIDVLVFNWDSYYDHGRNFYIYHNPDDDKFHWIPWDYNLAFASFSTDIIFQTVTPPIDGGSRPLIDSVLAENSLRTKYFDTYCNLLGYNFTTDRLFPIIDSTKNLIEAHHIASTNEFFTTSEFIRNLDSLVQGNSFFVFPGIKPFINTRITGVNNELTQLNHFCDTNYIAVGDVVINELVAANDSTNHIADQDGEHDDWIELYNNTNSSIDLNGYYLTDDFNDRTKWAIPDTTIAANGYLMIWADKDNEQTGLHADFKLSKNGEQLMLSTPNSLVIDSVTFGVQQETYSYARLPNGTGDFDVAELTFGASNNPVGTKPIQTKLDVAAKIYPNPAYEQVVIEFEKELTINRIQVINMTGQTMLEYPITVFNKQVTLNLKNIPVGMYFIVFQTDEQQILTKKLIISK